ncbi:hypothetical protein LX32DRAFT_643274 [Colletotrichum zoysiae]|uniref:Uncharacterized protein n=1 Tax=Colletotrichum zoysiae TaxID=1216348 RepID=A0AAD9H9C7_9PEZI|nr:hypothetical protein LX32DRAFT_643274 [Colletotrichum zoysiae]
MLGPKDQGQRNDRHEHPETGRCKLQPTVYNSSLHGMNQRSGWACNPILALARTRGFEALRWLGRCDNLSAYLVAKTLLRTDIPPEPLSSPSAGNHCHGSLDSAGPPPQNSEWLWGKRQGAGAGGAKSSTVRDLGRRNGRVPSRCIQYALSNINLVHPMPGLRRADLI